MSPAELDRAALLLARTRLHPPALERAVAGYSRLGEHAACWLALGTAGALTDRRAGTRRRWRRGTKVVAASYGLNFLVKLAIGRARPELEGLPPLTPTVSRLSCPSAHCTTSFAAARSFAGLAPAPALYGAAVAFALSRPYLGVHYPSDVLAGAALGTAIAELWPGGGPRPRPTRGTAIAELWPGGGPRPRSTRGTAIAPAWPRKRRR